MTFPVLKPQALLMCVLYLSQGPGASSQSGTSPIETLRAHDDAFLDSFTLRCQSVAPAEHRETEMSATSEVALTSSGPSLGFRQKVVGLFRSNPDDSVGAASRTIEYTGDTTVFINDGTATSCVFLYAIDYSYNEGRFMKNIGYTPLVSIYPVDHPQYKWVYVRFNPFLLALGRGYGRHLVKVLDYKEDTDAGTARLIAKGQMFSDPRPGVELPTWDIEIDLENDYLVRSATCSYPDPQIKSYLFLPEIASGIESPDDLPLWKGGKIIRDGLGGYAGDKSVKLLMYDREPDGDLLAESAEVADIRLSGTTVRDHTIVDGDGNPFHVRIK